MRKILFQGPSRDGLYPLSLDLHHTNKSISSPSAFLSFRVSSRICHHRLGHLAQEVLRLLSSKINIQGSNAPPSVCASCQMAKSSKLSFTFVGT